MKTLLLISIFMLPLSSFAQDAEVDCVKQFEEQMRSINASTMTAAGSPVNLTFAKVLSECVSAKKCVHMETILRSREIILDEELNKVEREKNFILERFVADNKEDLISNHHCAIVTAFGPVLDKLRSLDHDELNRINVLVRQQIAAIAKLMGEAGEK